MSHGSRIGRACRPHRPSQHRHWPRRGVAGACRSCVLQFALVVARYVFGFGSIWLTETVVYANAALFLLAAAWTLRAGGHVRVDVFYAQASARRRALIDLAGSVVLLLPFALVLLWLSAPYAARSWAILERSQESSGLPLVFLLKTLDPRVRAADGAARRRASDPRVERAGAALMLADILAVLMVAAVVAALMAGYPVALTLAGVSLAFAVLGDTLGVMDLRHPGCAAAAHLRHYDQRCAAGRPDVHLHGRDAAAIANRRAVARAHGPAVRQLARRARAFPSSSSARCSRPAPAWSARPPSPSGLVMLPAMLRHGYDPRLAAGTVAASATLAQIIPPSTVLVLLGDQLNNAYQAAQLAQGKVSPDVVSVSDLFAGALLPGLLLVGLYLAFLVVDGGAASANLSGSCRSRKAGRLDRSAAGAGRADRGGARLDPLRRGDADGSGLRRRGRRDPARRAQGRHRPPHAARWSRRPRRSPP